VVARDDDVELASGGSDKQGVSRKRSGDVDAVASACGNRGLEGVSLG
jgi:hypothetical protein